jgi:iron complex outermembrane receptor protein
MDRRCLNRFLLLASTAAATASLASAAYAEAVPAPADADAAQEVVVTGSTLRNQENIAIHRQALGVVDAVTQDDTGDLADETVADALIRLPGISTMQTLYGEQAAKYVSVRGISPDLNFVSFDGIGMFSASNDGAGSRRVDLNLIPTQVAQRTEVYKSFTSDLDAGAIGGVTNIVPYSAINGKNQYYLDATAEYQPSKNRVPGYNSMGGYLDTPWGGGLKGLYVHKFGADGQFGIVASGVYNQDSWTASKPNANGRTYYTAAGTTASADLSNWNGYSPMPTLIRPMDYTKTRRLFGGYLGLEYRASDSLELSASGYDYKQIEYQNLSDFYAETLSGVKYQSPTVATLKIGRLRAAFDYDLFKTESRGALVKAKKDFASDTTLELRGGYGLSKFYDKDLGAAYAYSPTNDFVTFDMGNSKPTFSFSNPSDMLDVSKYTGYSASDMYSRSAFKSYEGRADFRHHFSFDSEGLGFAAGFDVRRVTAQRDVTQTNYTPSGNLGALGSVADFHSLDYPYSTVFIDYDGFNRTVKPTLKINTTTSGNDSASADYTYRETVLAGYAAAMYATGGFRAIGGVRWDHVRFTADVPQQVGGVYNGSFRGYAGGYQHVLPSATITQELPSDFRLRAAFSQSLGRPAFSDIAQAEVRSNTALTISKGNPDLKPRQSDNYDLSVEHYFNNHDGLISIAGLYKKIRNDIFTLHTSQTIDGTVFDVTTPMNASQSTIKGIEFQFIDNRIAHLPGLLRDRVGVSVNATRLWAKMDFIVSGNVAQRNNMLYQPNWLVNGSIFYRLFDAGEFRVAYNWMDRSLNTVNAQPYQDYVLKARGQMNASLRLPVKRNLVVKFEADNILGANTSMMHGYFSERYTLGVNRRFMLDIVLVG